MNHPLTDALTIQIENSISTIKPDCSMAQAEDFLRGCMIKLRDHARKMESDCHAALENRDCWKSNARELQKQVNAWEPERARLIQERDNAVAKTSLAGFRAMGQQVADALDDRDAARTELLQLKAGMNADIEKLHGDLQALQIEITAARTGNKAVRLASLHEVAAALESYPPGTKSFECLTKAHRILNYNTPDGSCPMPGYDSAKAPASAGGEPEFQAVHLQPHKPVGLQYTNITKFPPRPEMLCTEGPFLGWILYQHPDGQWVSLQKLSDAEYAELHARLMKPRFA